jgi:phosphate transport system substrate-binding protein
MYSRLYLLFALIAAPIAFGQTCRIAGSDWLGPILGDALAQSSQLKGVELQMHFKGSIPAKQQLKAGKADIAIIASPQKEDLGASYHVIPLGFEVALVGVNVENPLNEINYKQLEGIFGASKNENIGRWSDLGLSGAWATRGIQSMLLPRQTGTTLLFIHDVLKEGNVRPTVRWVDTIHAIEQRLGADPGSIAILPFTSRVEATKLLAVAKESVSGVSFTPTEENIFYGDYPLRLPLYLVFSKMPSPETQKVVQVLLSEAVARKLSEQGVCPLPKKIRERTFLELDFNP